MPTNAGQKKLKKKRHVNKKVPLYAYICRPKKIKKSPYIPTYRQTTCLQSDI
jgi:hypothetical protein